jgi:outer membrane protein assembly factor BamD (BamD/ComL family)
MVEQDSLDFKKDVNKILNKAINLFKEIGNTDLAEKWTKVLEENYSQK